MSDRRITGHEIRPTASAEHSRRPGSVGHGWHGLCLGAALVVMALVAGLNFTFAVAVMPNLAGADDHTFVAVTQRFNQNPVFPVSFTVALLLVVLAAVSLAVLRQGAALLWTIIALVLYGVVLAITVVVHIPLNLEIDQVGDPALVEDLALVRSEFEGRWAAGNLVRTLFCTAAVAAMARALYVHGHRSHQGDTVRS